MRSPRFFAPLALLAAGSLLVAGLVLGVTQANPAEAQERGAWLGVALQDLTDELRAAMDIGREVRGALVSRVVPDSPADRAGLRDGDIITEIGNRATENTDDVIRTVRDHRPGDEVIVTVRRGERSRALKVDLGTRAEENDFQWFTPDGDERADREVRRHFLRRRGGADAPRSGDHFVFEDDEGRRHELEGEVKDSDKQRLRDRIRPRLNIRPPRPPMSLERSGGYLGVQTMELGDQLSGYFETPEGRGVLVTEVVEDSPADKAGLRAGDVILSFGEETVDSHSELRRAVRRTDPDTETAVTIMRKGVRKNLSVRVGSTGDRSAAPFDGEPHGMFRFDGEGLQALKDLPEMLGLGEDGMRMLFLPEHGEIDLEDLEGWEGLDDLEFNFKFDFDEDHMRELHEKLKGLDGAIEIHGLKDLDRNELRKLRDKLRGLRHHIRIHRDHDDHRHDHRHHDAVDSRRPWLNSL